MVLKVTLSLPASFIQIYNVYYPDSNYRLNSGVCTVERKIQFLIRLYLILQVFLLNIQN
jgi:hypothetical protein